MTSTEYNLTTDRLDPTDPRTIDWAERQRRAVVPFELETDSDGIERPVNPIDPTLPAGRGALWHWGEAVCADAVVRATVDGTRYLLMIERGDGHGWALPGGKLDAGETPLTAAARELEEETGLPLEEGAFTMLAGRGVPDPRAGRHAWMVTVPGVVDLRPERLPRVVGQDDARNAAWVTADSWKGLTAALLTVGGQVFAAHVDLIRDVLADATTPQP